MLKRSRGRVPGVAACVAAVRVLRPRRAAKTSSPRDSFGFGTCHLLDDRYPGRAARRIAEGWACWADGLRENYISEMRRARFPLKTAPATLTYGSSTPVRAARSRSPPR